MYACATALRLIPARRHGRTEMTMIAMVQDRDTKARWSCTDQRLRLMTDTWNQLNHTHQEQVKEELGKGAFRDDRYQELFEDLCPPQLHITEGLHVVRIAQIMTELWVVTGLRDEAHREWVRDRQENPRSQPRKQSTPQGQAYEPVSPERSRIINNERALSTRRFWSRGCPRALDRRFSACSAPSEHRSRL